MAHQLEQEKKKVAALEQRLQYYEQNGGAKLYYSLQRKMNEMADMLNKTELNKVDLSDAKDKTFDRMLDRGIKYWIFGHGHPAVKITDGVKIEKYKCFLSGKFKGREIIIVPSFFEYSEGSDPRENDLGMAWKFDLEKFNVWAVGEDLESKKLHTRT